MTRYLRKEKKGTNIEPLPPRDHFNALHFEYFGLKNMSACSSITELLCEKIMECVFEANLQR